MASVFVSYGESSEENADIYAYACEAIIAFLVNLSLSLVIALMFGRVREGLIFVLVFAWLRRYTGGYHAKTHFSCILAFSCIFAGSMALLSLTTWFGLGGHLALWFASISLIGIILFSIAEQKLRYLGIKKKKGIGLASAIFLFCFIDFYILNSQIGFVLSLSMFSVFGSMAYVMVYKYLKQGGE